MYKLLVNCLDDTQSLIVITKSGKYNDLSKVLWDERTDGPLPAITLGGMVRSDNTLVFDQARKGQHDAVITSLQNEESRKAAIQAAINSDTVINDLKSMTNAEYNAWWSSNVTNAAQAIGLLKKITRLIIRRIL